MLSTGIVVFARLFDTLGVGTEGGPNAVEEGLGVGHLDDIWCSLKFISDMTVKFFYD